MKRQWNWQRDVNGGGVRFAEALACLSTEQYVRSVLTCAGALENGHEVRFVALRAKFDPATGEPLDDHRQPGDYLTIGYRFQVDAGEQGETWEVDREPSFEGEQAASDLAGALALHTDRDFCETMVQVKAALDRFGGQVFIRPFMVEGEEEPQVGGLAAHYEHLVRDQEREPDAERLPEEGPRTEDSESGSGNPAESGFGPPTDQDEEAADSPDPAPEPVEA